MSETTAAARAFVTAHLPAARTLGRSLANHLDDPGAFTDATRTGLSGIADPAYLAGQRLVAPGIGPTLGIRTPLLGAVAAGLRREVRGVGPARILVVAEALARDEIRELRWLAIRILGWIVELDPERTWQVIRRIGRDADDWITVDALAAVTAAGILAEPYRWAELEQLVYSRSRWERRLVGSTIATLAQAGHPSGHSEPMTARGLDLVGQLIGDAEPAVQKALSWALRELAKVEPVPVAAFCRSQARDAGVTADGHRAWVLRDALAQLPAADAGAIRAALVGIRRASGAAPTSIAAAAAAAFLAVSPGRPAPEALLP
ncbi:MAG TPA: DNA alkylation repair protein [Patescibacteria group bacterium]|nr:DNA alkylation repair protein [Patescibacteria group bacterium]